MNLIKCAACGREISPNASACPHCGEPVPKTEAKPKAKNQDLNTGCAIAMLACLVLVFGGCIMFELRTPSAGEIASQKKQTAELLSENSKWDGSVYYVEQYLKQNLKDPDSYESIDWSPVEHLSDGKLRVRHKYRAKNSFGGYIIANQIFTYDANGTVYSVTDF